MMIFSDSLPIQFWTDETFNQKEVWGLSRQDCFCQPVECGDELTVQFITPEYLAGGLEPDYQLVAVMETGATLGTLPISYVGPVDGGYLFSITFSMEDFGSPCVDRKLAFRISIFAGPSGDRALTGAVTDLMEQAAGIIQSSDGITGAITDLLETAAGTIENQFTITTNTKVGDTLGSGNFVLQYRINSGSWIDIGSTIYTQLTCELLAPILVQKNDAIEFRCVRQSNFAAIRFNYSPSASCPASLDNFSIAGPFTITDHATYSFTAYVDLGDYLDV